MVEVPRGDIFTKLNFVKAIEDGQEPYYLYVRIPPPEGKPFMNLKFVPIEINIQDLRGKLDTVNLNKPPQSIKCPRIHHQMSLG